MPNQIKFKPNHRVGKLVIVEDTGTRIRKQVVWKCKCDCGNVLERLSGYLSQAERLNQNAACSNICSQSIELAGKKFGHLTALERTEKILGKGWYWKFRCDCGTEVVKKGAQVSRGQGALHCGCKRYVGGHNKIDLTGKKFGQFLVIDRNGTNDFGQSLWNVQCDCGKIFVKKGMNLRRGVGCGCPEQRSEHSTTWKGLNDLSGVYLSRLKRGAQQRALEFSITPDYLWNLYEKQQRQCSLSGVDIVLTRSLKNQTASLDRIDSNQGYVEGNVHWVHKDINTMKWDFKLEDFLEWCKRVAKRIEQTD